MLCLMRGSRARSRALAAPAAEGSPAGCTCTVTDSLVVRGAQRNPVPCQTQCSLELACTPALFCIKGYAMRPAPAGASVFNGVRGSPGPSAEGPGAGAGAAPAAAASDGPEPMDEDALLQQALAMSMQVSLSLGMGFWGASLTRLSIQGAAAPAG